MYGCTNNVFDVAFYQAIGRPVMPPYWSLGFHLCKWEIGNISDVEAVVERTKQAKIPQVCSNNLISLIYTLNIITKGMCV